jgi:lipopolysaccharide biosynthesis glycosyltransferase
MSKNLVYFTVGYNIEFLDLLDLSIKSMKLFEKDIDIFIICDEIFVEKCNIYFNGNKNIKILPIENSKSKQHASMHKLNIFDYDISNYEKVLFVDCDILFHTEITESIFKNIISNKLYVYTEFTDLSWHTQLYFSLKTYTPSQLEYFKQNQIYVFNAGLFGFVNTPEMKNHFSKIRSIISNHKGPFFYEQSFMNYYFNLNNQTDRLLLTTKNYEMFHSTPENIKSNKVFKNKLIHFCGADTGASTKLDRMQKYFNNNLLSITNVQ